jgi:hypothetical protein
MGCLRATFQRLPLIAFLATGLACSAGSGPAEPAAVADAVECSDPRPQACTREYLPVCAERDNGVRCVTTPCDSTEPETYANGCTACSDPLVLRYRPGACADDEAS